ncbi:MAG: MopE-related protein, partial [Bradymonadaceae bacterium]
GGSWGPCRGGAEPEPSESCDGEDDDCDGDVDESSECKCRPGETQKCGHSTGVCERGVQTCKDGSWGECTGGIEGSRETCNGKDDDCDGRVDEMLRRPCGTNDGQCSKGTQNCRGGSWSACNGGTRPSNDTCNGKDDDCDGQTDELNPRSCGKSTGRCRKGRRHCRGGSWTACMGATTPTSESCNGKDDDCNGQTDDLQARSCGKDTGRCQQGRRRCTNGSWSTCTGATAPRQERCDGVDDDCDGQTDELGPRSCGTAVGACARGTKRCQNGQWSSCSGGVQPSPEICDAEDDDCDGATDEDPVESEDFEGKDPGWSKFVDGSNRVSVDLDHSGTSSGGSESVHAHGARGVCGNAGGAAHDFDLKGDPQIVKIDIKATAPDWGRANLLLKDSSGYHVLWEKKGKGNGFSIGWTTKTFDISDYDDRFKLVIGNADDSSPHCKNFDHDWKMWADNLQIQYRREIGFEGSGADEVPWNSFSTGNVSNSFSTSDDATDHASRGSESARASGARGACGTAAGISRQYSFASQPDKLVFWYRTETRAYGRVNMLLKDSSGWHTIMQRKAGGTALNTGWQPKVIDVSKYDRNFRLVFGNGDNNRYCNNSDHEWTLWV